MRLPSARGLIAYLAGILTVVGGVSATGVLPCRLGPEPAQTLAGARPKADGWEEARALLLHTAMARPCLTFSRAEGPRLSRREYAEYRRLLADAEQDRAYFRMLIREGVFPVTRHVEQP